MEPSGAADAEDVSETVISPDPHVSGELEGYPMHMGVTINVKYDKLAKIHFAKKRNNSKIIK